MKTLKIALFIAALTALSTFAGEPSKASPEFEKMKSLAGTWKGTADIGGGPIDMTVQYRLIAGGTVLEERVFPNTPNEMLTMYYEKGGKLALTHYCILGNRPGMLLKSADERTLNFDLDETCGLSEKSPMHMHAMSLRFDSPDRITTTCKSFADGIARESHPCTLKRVKS